jgi:thiamine transport system permease protein
MDPGLDTSRPALRPGRRLSGRLLLWLPPLAFLGLFYFYPLGAILQASFAAVQGDPLGPVRQALTSASIRQVVAFTFGQAALSTLLTFVVGLPGAYLLARFELPGKTWIRVLTSIPFVMPTLVVAAGFSALLGSQGWVNQLLMRMFHLGAPPIHFANTLAAILAAHVFYNTTIVLKTVGGFWANLDVRLMQAAAVLGARRWQVVRHVTLPLLAPAILSAAVLIFIFDFTSFGVILILGGPHFATLEVEIYYQTISLFNLPLAAVLSLLQLLCTLGMMSLYTWLVNRLSRPLDLKPQAAVLRRLYGWKEKLFAFTYLAFLLGFMTLPLLALALQSVTSPGGSGWGRMRPGVPGQAAAGFTLDFYRALFENQRQSIFYAAPATAITISLAYALLTVLLSLATGLPAAVALANPESSPQMKRLNRLLDPILMLPLGTSAVTLGLGFIIALAYPPLDLRTSPLLVPLAHTLVAFPFVVRSLVPALRSIQPRLRQAAGVMGASPARVFQTVDLPLISRAILVGATFAFTISIGEFGASALITRPEYPTIPVAIYRLISLPGAMNYGQGLALSTILMLVSAGGMLAIEHLRLGESSEF